ncbi:hypothetical protein K4F52_010376 [Lecanicillium sp. MT-2017a]|nr:hypothetical protein K4F52_010376 [Lecanicillium sp. MT-2017a]
MDAASQPVQQYETGHILAPRVDGPALAVHQMLPLSWEESEDEGQPDVIEVTDDDVGSVAEVIELSDNVTARSVDAQGTDANNQTTNVTHDTEDTLEVTCDSQESAVTAVCPKTAQEPVTVYVIDHEGNYQYRGDSSQITTYAEDLARHRPFDLLCPLDGKWIKPGAADCYARAAQSKGRVLVQYAKPVDWNKLGDPQRFDGFYERIKKKLDEFREIQRKRPFSGDADKVADEVALKRCKALHCHTMLFGLDFGLRQNAVYRLRSSTPLWKRIVE